MENAIKMEEERERERENDMMKEKENEMTNWPRTRDRNRLPFGKRRSPNYPYSMPWHFR